MKTLVKAEALKLRTTPALYICGGIVAALTAVSVVANIELAGKSGAPALGTPENVDKVFSVAALSAMVALAVGIVMLAGEYRHRTIVASFLAEPRRGRVIAAKLITAGVYGAVTGAVAFGLATAIALPMYAAKGIHHVHVDIPRLWLGAILASACYGMLGVALGAVARNTVGAIVGAVVWVQLIEVGILQQAAPSVAKWLPTGAAVAITSGGKDAAHLLAPGVAAVVLVAWAALLSVASARLTVNREVR